MRGATYPAVTDKDILGSFIPLPSIPEQHRIIGRIKECMERVEEVENLRAEAVPERVMLLRSFYYQTYIDLLKIHPTKKLGELGTSSGGGTPSKNNAAFWNGDIPWISPKDMKKSALSDSALHISKEAIKGSAAKLIPAGSVLFVVRGMILAHTLPVAINLVDAAINQDMKAITAGIKVLPEFLATMIRGAERQLLSKVEIAGHGTCRLQTEHWSSLPIPVPNLDEQQEIMAKVAAFESFSDALGNDLKPFDSTLRDAILRRAFAGEL
jgi:type I restriction enzyme S subunit